MLKPPHTKGTKVRFLVDNLGASYRDELFSVTEHRAMYGDVGVVAFPHPNKRLADWFYVEIDTADYGLLYVGVTAKMVELVT